MAAGISSCPACGKPTQEVVCQHCGALCATPADARALVGVVINGQYELQELLGQGGMGAVFRALQISMERPVAVKVLPGNPSPQSEVVKRFKQEARVTSRLVHPNTVRVYDFGQAEDGILYLVMELLNGEELSRHVKRVGPLPPPRAVSICAQVLRSLSEAHTLGVVHRDLKPANIFLQVVPGSDELVKVMDFGLAKTFLTEATAVQNLTRAGFVMGTPEYMSPEQAAARTVGPAADLYAVGVILFHLLTGRVPFSAATPFETAMKHVREAPPTLASVRPELARFPELQDAVSRLMAKDPAARPASAQDAVTILQAILDRKGPRGSTRGDPAPEDRSTASVMAEFVREVETAADAIAAEDDARVVPAVPTAALVKVPGVATDAETTDWEADPAHAEGGTPTEKSERGRAVTRVAVAAAVVVSMGLGFVGVRALVARPATPPPAPVMTPPVATAQVRLTVTSEPPGAFVIVANERLGTAPASIQVPADERVAIRLQLDGHEDTVMSWSPGEPTDLKVKLVARPRAQPAQPAQPDPSPPEPAQPAPAPVQAAPAPAPRADPSPPVRKEAARTPRATTPAKAAPQKGKPRRRSDDEMLESL